MNLLQINNPANTLFQLNSILSKSKETLIEYCMYYGSEVEKYVKM